MRDNRSPGRRRETGAKGEDIAEKHLRRLGYSIVERNYRCREGEIDIIAWQDDCLVFVEVKTRTGGGFGTPEESVTPLKQERLALLADAYIQGLGEPPEFWRIDVVGVELGSGGRVVRLEHIENVTG